MSLTSQRQQAYKSHFTRKLPFETSAQRTSKTIHHHDGPVVIARLLPGRTLTISVIPCEPAPSSGPRFF
jgi:hypothetical protein